MPSLIRKNNKTELTIHSGVMIEDAAEIVRLLSDTSEGRPEREVRLQDDGAHVRKHTRGPIEKAEALDSSALEAACTAVGLPYEEAYAERTQWYWGNDERPDGHGDVVLQNWDFTDYLNNPLLCYNHRWDALPIGNCVAWEVVERTESDYSGPALKLLAVFATREQNEWADSCHRLVRARFLRAGSVGFVSRRVIDVKDAEERAALGLGRYGYVLDDNVLYEYSVTTLGANSGAYSVLSAAKKSGLLLPADMQLAREIARTIAKDQKTWDSEDRQLLSISRCLFPTHEFTSHKALDVPVLQLPFKRSATLVKTEVKPTVDERLAAIEKSIGDLSTAFSEYAASTLSSITDIRSLCEDGDLPDGDGVDEVSDETLARLERLTLPKAG